MDLLKEDTYQRTIPELKDDKDTDKLYFVDFLSQPEELIHNGDEYLEWLRNFRVAIIEGLNRYSSANIEISKKELRKADKERVFKKYRWLLEYWNNVVEDENTPFPVPDIDNKDKIKFMDMYKKLRISKRYPYR